jgi:Bacterial aa3 type cytochrome c oxidase subunit IV
MAVVDPDFEQHRRTWIAFTRLIRYVLATIVIVLVGLAIFTL